MNKPSEEKSSEKTSKNTTEKTSSTLGVVARISHIAAAITACALFCFLVTIWAGWNSLAFGLAVSSSVAIICWGVRIAGLVAVLMSQWHKRLPPPLATYPLFFFAGTAALYLLAEKYGHKIYEAGPLVLAAREIAFAVIVASIIGLTIEAYNERRNTKMAKKLQEDVFGAVYENRLSKNVYSVVRAHILSSPVVGTKYVISVSFLNHIADATKIEVVVRINREVKNVSGAQTTYNFRSGFLFGEGSSSPYSTKFEYLEINGAEVDIESHQHNPKGEAKYVFVPLVLQADQSVAIGVEARLTMDRSDHLPLLLTLPTDRLTVNIRAPDDLTIRAKAIHPRPMVEEKRKCPGLDQVWRIKSGLFPGNGAIISWQPSSLRTEGAISLTNSPGAGIIS